MISIRLRLFLILGLTATAAIGLTFSAGTTFLKYRDLRRQVDASYQVVQTLEDLSVRHMSRKKLDQLKQLQERLSPESRAKELANLIDSYANHKLGSFYPRRKTMRANELEYQRYTRGRLDYLEQRVIYLAGIAIGTLIFGFIVIQFFISRSVIRPLSDLGRKMNDFVNERYTYQFSVPSSDEVGLMQATFNSLAQRVLTNMEELKTLDSAKSEFLSIASHELRTPLTSIKGSLSLLKSGLVGAVNEMAENLLNIAETETDRLIRLINDVLDLAKIEARRLPLSQEWNSLDELIETTFDSLQGLARSANVHLIAGQVPQIQVYMDKDRAQQVLTNLLSNAIKFSPENASVTVHCDVTEDDQLLIEVKDQGKGISPQDQELIFQKFRQATSESNPLVKGTGLGLAIARALVEEHGGTIGVHSVPDEGSTFYFTLPKWKFERVTAEVAV